MDTEPEFVGIAGIDGVNEANAIVAVLIWRCDFRFNRAEEPRPAVYQSPKIDGTAIYVYGDYTAPERSKICEATALVVQQLQTKPVDLYFYAQERKNEDLIEHRHFKNDRA